MTADFALAAALGAIFGALVAVGAVFAAVSLLSSQLRPYIMPKPPPATVCEQHDAEKEVLREISETTIAKLQQHLQKEGLSSKAARQEAEKMAAGLETYGESPW